jgi:ribosomal-protein-serine acetyltransferase
MVIHAVENIMLSSLEYSHATDLLQLTNANRTYLREWLPWVDHIQTVGHFHTFIDQCKKKQAAGTDFAFMIMYNGVPTGRIGIYNIDKQHKIGSIGYWLGQSFEGKGIVTKACRAIIHYGFNTLNLSRIEIKCGTGNNKSKAVAQRLGFTDEGIIPRGELLYNHFIDLQIYVMLRDDWYGKQKGNPTMH